MSRRATKGDEDRAGLGRFSASSRVLQGSGARLPATAATGGFAAGGNPPRTHESLPGLTPRRCRQRGGFFTQKPSPIIIDGSQKCESTQFSYQLFS